MLPNFFKDVLGNSGAAVMQHLAKASEVFEAYLLPRVIVGWLRSSAYGDINIPAECPMTALQKTGYGYSGSADFGGLEYSFSNAPEEHVAAVITVALGKSIESVDVRDIDLARLAKTIDMLCKAAPKAPANQFEHQEVASAIQPEGPISPVLTQPAQNKKVAKTPKIPRLKSSKKSLKITKTESGNTCQVCGHKLFENGVFVGCVCFGPLAKNCKTLQDKSGFTIVLGGECDEDAYLSLIGVFKNGR
jgi:hypothetical protein